MLRLGRQPASPSPAGNLAPLLGGNLPAPTQDVTITWDPRFKKVSRKASLAGQYLVIEGDIVIGTQDFVRKARRDELAARAKRLRGTAKFEDLGCPRRPSTISTISPVTPGTEATSSVTKADAASLLLDTRRSRGRKSHPFRRTVGSPTGIRHRERRIPTGPPV